jgi:hypothetical protein
MSVELHEEAGGKILVLTLSGTLSKDDYAHFTPEVERAVRTHGKVRMLVRMHDFHGWTLGAVWADVKFDARHYADIERLALVGDARWEAGMANFCRPFTAAAIQYFDADRAGDAAAWINEGIGQPVSTA